VPRDWDAVTYDRLSAPMTRWGADVVGRLELRGEETVLDAGCGTGKVTGMLMSRLPHGAAIALDGSPAMIGRARKKLVRFGSRVKFLVADLRIPLPLGRPVDAILSTATFHWILDHDALFRNLAAVLRPGGQLVAQCGGHGNIASIEAALHELGHDFEGRKHYATVDETTQRLRRSGFTDVEVWTNDAPTPIAPDDLEAYLEAICLGDHVAEMSSQQTATFVSQVAARLPGPQIDYVRLNINARRTRDESGNGPR
jgi:trans-aconitate 2-methyltransferase